MNRLNRMCRFYSRERCLHILYFKALGLEPRRDLLEAYGILEVLPEVTRYQRNAKVGK